MGRQISDDTPKLPNERRLQPICPRNNVNLYPPRVVRGVRRACLACPEQLYGGGGDIATAHSPHLLNSRPGGMLGRQFS